jgi:hypothetical protein
MGQYASFSSSSFCCRFILMLFHRYVVVVVVVVRGSRRCSSGRSSSFLVWLSPSKTHQETQKFVVAVGGVGGVALPGRRRLFVVVKNEPGDKEAAAGGAPPQTVNAFVVIRDSLLHSDHVEKAEQSDHAGRQRSGDAFLLQAKSR